MSTPLKEILTTETEEVKTETEEVTGDTETKAEETEVVADANTEETKTEETEAAPPADDKLVDQVADLTKQVRAFRTKAEDEVRKRQSLEKKVEPADAYTEPDKAIEQAVQMSDQRSETRFLNMSESQANARYDDFEAMKSVFFDEMVADNPSLQVQALSEPDPYAFIYNQAKNFSEMKGVGNLSEWTKNKEKEIRGKIEAENAEKAKAEAEQAINDAIPNTLSDVTAAAGTNAKRYSGPTPLNKIVGKR